jgi:predicted MPP superfamily phosphohydrolase
VGWLVAARARVDVGPIRGHVSILPSRVGGLEVGLPPLGAARFRAHRAPVRISAVVDEIDPDAVADFVGERTNPTELLETVRTAATQAARQAATRSALAGLAGAAALAALAGRGRRGVAGATASAAGLLAITAGAVAATWDRAAFRDPELSGLLAKAPLVLGDLRQAPGRVEMYQRQLAELIGTATAVHRQIAELPPAPPADAIRLLHVSDLHLSPIGMHLVAALVEQCQVDAVVDSGDVVDWGTPAETVFTDLAGRVGVPYVYVRGNHDSVGTAAAMASLSNVVVLDGSPTPVEVAGLGFVGVADPRFTPDKTTGDDDTPPARLRAAGRQLADAVRAAGTHPDIAVAHDPAVARQLAGLVPLALAGHTHQRAARQLQSTLLLVQGTSGGSGLRGVQHIPPTPLSFSVLHLERESRRLHTVDEVTADGLGAAAVSIRRRPVADLAASRP